MKIEKKHDVCQTLGLLEDNNIEYAVLRSYFPIKCLNESKDVDIYTPLRYKRIIDGILKKEGWVPQKLNCSRYPHCQYIKIIDGGIRKLDFVFGLYYSDKLYHYQAEDSILKSKRKIDGVFVLGAYETLKTFIFHIIFDKGKLSDSNKESLNKILEEYNKNRSEEDNKIFETIGLDLLNSSTKEKEKKIIEKYKNLVKKENNLEYSIFRHIYRYTFWQLKNYIRLIWLKLSKKSIAVIGVDGSGKSTATTELLNTLNNHAVLQYMGFKEYEINIVKKHFANPKESNVYKINSLLLQYMEMINRYYKYRYSKKVVIYDRYPWEAAINYHGISKILTNLQYRILFPRPKKIYYLYCDVKTSLSRKDDITNKEQFTRMKNRFDKEYLNNKKIKSFSTDEMSVEEIQQEIENDLNENFLKYLI